jgi:predicted nicotinamide N-methyase
MCASPSDDLESQLRGRFQLREELFEHASRRWRLLLPADPEALIDEAAFDADERLPYWADLWPAAKALTRFFLDSSLPPAQALELGCGIALPSLALRAKGVPVLATDYEADALPFARANAQRNGLGDLPTAVLDWRAIPGEFPRFDLVVGADVLYEPHHAAAIAQVLDRVLLPDGQALFAGPGRRHEPRLREILFDQGWRAEELACLTEGQANAAPSTVRITRLTRRR